MAYTLSDIYIGNFSITQNFGARPDVYSARYGLKGHNGIDIGCPSHTMILSAADGFASEVNEDPGGYGKYIKIVHDGYLTLYAHLNDFVIKKGDHVVAGQLIAHSNNTGFSDAPHLHFGVAPCDAQGIKTEPNNGFSGYIDPMSSLCHWDIKNPTQPVDPKEHEEVTKIPVPSTDFTRMVSQGSNYKVIASWAISHGLNEYLTTVSLPLVDLENHPEDPTAGENLVKFLSTRFSELEEVKTKVTQSHDEAKTTIEQDMSPEDAAQIVATTPLLTNLFTKLFTNIKTFVFVQK